MCAGSTACVPKRGQTDTSLPGGHQSWGWRGVPQSGVGGEGGGLDLGLRPSLPTGCFSKDQVYLDGILRILRHPARPLTSHC